MRAWCEAHGIPVQMGNEEEIPSFWRLRETQALVGWLRGRESRLVAGTDLRGWLDARPSGPWIDLLREARDEHALETGGGAEVPVAHFIEWLAEWGRDVRRRQRGLLLSTAHRAKGLEFDHVVVLDGGWDRFGKDEDPDAPRRLYYVAMTRARQTLALARLVAPRPSSSPDAGWRSFDFVREPPHPAYPVQRHPLQQDIEDSPSVLRRQSGGVPPEPPKQMPELERRYRYPSLREINLGFAGRRRSRDPVHRAIASLEPGDPLLARMDAHERWELLDRSGTVVGRLGMGLRVSGRDAVRLRRRPCRRDLEPRRLRARVPGRAEVRPLGGGGAGAGVRAGSVALRPNLSRLCVRNPDGTAGTAESRRENLQDARHTRGPAARQAGTFLNRGTDSALDTKRHLHHAGTDGLGTVGFEGEVF